MIMTRSCRKSIKFHGAVFVFCFVVCFGGYFLGTFFVGGPGHRVMGSQGLVLRCISFQETSGVVLVLEALQLARPPKPALGYVLG